MATTTSPVVKQPKKVPEHAPFQWRLVQCDLCGQVVRPTEERLGKNQIVALVYYHENKATGCDWKLTDSTRYSEGQVLGMRDAVPDGVDATGRPKFKDEHDLAVGTSFNPDDLMRAISYFVQHFVEGRTTIPRSGNREISS